LRPTSEQSDGEPLKCQLGDARLLWFIMFLAEDSITGEPADE
jgi:hypothetical protein